MAMEFIKMFKKLSIVDIKPDLTSDFNRVKKCAGSHTNAYG